jgi:hypothetical protein
VNPRPLFAVLAFSIACGSAPVDRDASAVDDASVGSDSGARRDAGRRSDAGARVPSIAEALDCGSGPPSGPGDRGELQRHDLDIDTFPDALCNDGSAAVLYYRPYEGEANRNRWLINLNGGGGCSGGPSCASRWCACAGTGRCPFVEEQQLTNFTMNNMSTSDEGPTLSANGIMLRDEPERANPIGGYNQVRLVYCSSDAWSGTARDVVFDAVHPVDGGDVRYAIHFLGARILDADLSTLRREGAEALVYTLGGAEREMPDLDEAIEVIVSGDSAGGAGVITNVDRVAEMLRSNNVRCGDGACPLEIRALIDAIVGPDMSGFDFSESIFAADGVDTYAEFVRDVVNAGDTLQGAVQDQSCLSWHAENMPGTEAVCADKTHVIRHHVTTPFFVRMALFDQLISNSYVSLELSFPELGPLTIPRFGQILQRELANFPSLSEFAEEGSEMEIAPGVFAPGCTNHDTIWENAEVYGTSITPAEGGDPLHLFDLFEPWRAGIEGARTAIVSEAPASNTQCGT